MYGCIWLCIYIDIDTERERAREREGERERERERCMAVMPLAFLHMCAVYVPTTGRYLNVAGSDTGAMTC